jgi:hypothetical protein
VWLKRKHEALSSNASTANTSHHQNKKQTTKQKNKLKAKTTLN